MVRTLRLKNTNPTKGQDLNTIECASKIKDDHTNEHLISNLGASAKVAPDQSSIINNSSGFTGRNHLPLHLGCLLTRSNEQVDVNWGAKGDEVITFRAPSPVLSSQESLSSSPIAIQDNFKQLREEQLQNQNVKRRKTGKDLGIKIGENEVISVDDDNSFSKESVAKTSSDHSSATLENAYAENHFQMKATGQKENILTKNSLLMKYEDRVNSKAFGISASTKNRSHMALVLDSEKYDDSVRRFLHLLFSPIRIIRICDEKNTRWKLLCGHCLTNGIERILIEDQTMKGLFCASGRMIYNHLMHCQEVQVSFKEEIQSQLVRFEDEKMIDENGVTERCAHFFRELWNRSNCFLE
mmetsp:Transcript_2153/g.2923  ORF Transcript_2153/g.2923 Transcript_2153/m.2923 type:complete len:354 (+) Transcript_2153:94-1155(+)